MFDCVAARLRSFHCPIGTRGWSLVPRAAGFASVLVDKSIIVVRPGAGIVVSATSAIVHLPWYVGSGRPNTGSKCCISHAFPRPASVLAWWMGAQDAWLVSVGRTSSVQSIPAGILLLPSQGASAPCRPEQGRLGFALKVLGDVHHRLGAPVSAGGRESECLTGHTKVEACDSSRRPRTRFG